MNRSIPPRVLFPVLVAAAAVAQPAAALPPSTTPAAAPRPQLVDDNTLAQVSGKYYGANMLVGLRIDLISTLQTSAGSAIARGSLAIQRSGSGYRVRVDSHADTQLNQAGAATSPTNATVGGGEHVQVNGIGQISQIAGDGNRMLNLTTISFAPSGNATGDFNGAATSTSSDGPLTARITFGDGGVQLGLQGPGANIAQQVTAGPNGAGGHITQLGQLGGTGLIGTNQLQLQLMTQTMSWQLTHQLGIRQALSGLSQLNR